MILSFCVDLHSDSVSRPHMLGLPFSSDYGFSARAPHLQLSALFPGSGREPLFLRRRRLFAMLDTLDRVAKEEMYLRIRTSADLSEFCRAGGRALLFSIEGGGFLPEDLPILCSRGVRVLSLVWDRNGYGASSRESGTATDTGLTADGVRVLSLCEKAGILPDVSHLSDRAFADLAEHTSGALLATHSDFRAVAAHPRNLTAEQSLLIAARGGLIGLNLYPPFLSDTGRGTVDDLLRHVEYGLSLCGEHTLALGLDIDGTDGEYPEGISLTRSIHDRVVDALLSRYPASLVDRIAGGNAADFFAAHLPDAC